MRIALVSLLSFAAACGSETAPPPAEETAGAERSNQNAPPPPHSAMTVREQTERLVALVAQGQTDPDARPRLRGEIAALPLEDPDVIQGRSACLDAWRAEEEGREDVEMAQAACRAVFAVLSGRLDLAGAAGRGAR